MKKVLKMFLGIVAMSVLYSCSKITGHGPIVTETRNVPAFTGVNFDLPGNLHYTPGATFKVELSSQQNLLDVIETYVSGNDLKIRVKSGVNIKSKEDIDVFIEAPDLTYLSLGGSGYMEVSQIYKPADLRLAVSGSGRIQISQLETNLLKAEISGSGDLQINNGKSNREQINISGSGMADFLNFPTDDAVTHTSGSGTIQLQVNKTLEAYISGSGVVMYKGNPTVKASVSGSGRVVKL